MHGCAMFGLPHTWLFLKAISELLLSSSFNTTLSLANFFGSLVESLYSFKIAGLVETAIYILTKPLLNQLSQNFSKNIMTKFP